MNCDSEASITSGLFFKIHQMYFNNLMFFSYMFFNFTFNIIIL
jgi:hypothetical protein